MVAKAYGKIKPLGALGTFSLQDKGALPLVKAIRPPERKDF
jgi:hypothetical protein